MFFNHRSTCLMSHPHYLWGSSSSSKDAARGRGSWQGRAIGSWGRRKEREETCEGTWKGTWSKRFWSRKIQKKTDAPSEIPEVTHPEVPKPIEVPPCSEIPRIEIIDEEEQVPDTTAEPPTFETPTPHRVKRNQFPRSRSRLKRLKALSPSSSSKKRFSPAKQTEVPKPKVCIPEVKSDVTEKGQEGEQNKKRRKTKGMGSKASREIQTNTTKVAPESEVTKVEEEEEKDETSKKKEQEESKALAEQKKKEMDAAAKDCKQSLDFLLFLWLTHLIQHLRLYTPQVFASVRLYVQCLPRILFTSFVISKQWLYILYYNIYIVLDVYILMFNLYIYI